MKKVHFFQFLQQSNIGFNSLIIQKIKYFILLQINEGSLTSMAAFLKEHDPENA